MSLSSNQEVKTNSKLQTRVLPVLVSILGTIIALYPSNPNNMTLPSRDSGVFLYIGWRFLNGDIPYRDVWDHKPPLIYFVDALGLTLTPHSLWESGFSKSFLFFLHFSLSTNYLTESSEFTLPSLGQLSSHPVY